MSHILTQYINGAHGLHSISCAGTAVVVDTYYRNNSHILEPALERRGALYRNEESMKMGVNPSELGANIWPRPLRK